MHHHRQTDILTQSVEQTQKTKHTGHRIEMYNTRKEASINLIKKCVYR